MLRNLLPLVGGLKRVIRLTLGNCRYSYTYPLDVTTTKESLALNWSATAGLGSCKADIVVARFCGSMTICSVDLVVNAAIDEFAWIAKAVIGVPTSGSIDLVWPVCKSNANPPPVWVPTMSW